VSAANRIAGLVAASAVCLAPARAGAWASAEHQVIGQTAYRRACDDLAAIVAARPQAPGVADRLEFACGRNRDALADVYGDACAIAGDFLGEPSEFMSISGAWRWTSKKSYLLLALENSQHFNPMATKEWAKYHEQAVVEGLAGEIVLGDRGAVPEPRPGGAREPEHDRGARLALARVVEVKGARPVDKHAIDVVGDRDLGPHEQCVPGGERPEHEHGEGDEPRPERAGLGDPELEVDVGPKHDREGDRRDRAADGRRSVRDPGPRGRRIEDGRGEPEHAEPPGGAERQTEAGDRADEPRDLGADRLLRHREQETGGDEQGERHEQQRHVAEHAREGGRPLARAGDDVDRPLGEAEHLHDHVEQGDEADDPGDLGGPVDRVHDLSERGVQELVPGGDLRGPGEGRRRPEQREVIEGLERPQRHDQRGDDREHGEERERRRQQREAVGDDPAHDQDRDPEGAVPERPPAAQRRAIAAPDRADPRDDAFVHP